MLLWNRFDYLLPQNLSASSSVACRCTSSSSSFSSVAYRYTSGRRGLGLDVAGLYIKKHSFGAPNPFEVETPTIRKPFSPISVPVSIPSENVAFGTTPLKPRTVADEENKTPKVMPIFTPTTPSTVLVPMQTTMTPAPPPPVPFATNLVQEIPEEIEYSFEERRAGFVLPKTHVKSMIQV
ncbi:65-kDa microtubule-associated protein 3-like [Pyrus ussuriensis x Pyrus communis]|uniref:65-kDa microtubule-associated protein 3-like n=1 Tax=Pyrus ussuriensis x Pyrus communis TaxID=2448454 RepID=A0A5N5I6H5_9ROSA|nr:65-kDa microtubule-associated protein 3-like [Pyrus ussuriensis x Pyrus communis]